MPFAGYRDFAECVRQNQQARNPEAYCGSIKHKVEDKMQKAIDSASYLSQLVRSAVSIVAKRDPVKEEGDKKLTADDGTANEGAQDDQAFAVAFGPDNYDKLVKRIIKAPYQDAYNAASKIVKALENKQFNFPGNIEEALKKAHAAVHGREMWDARYGDVCDLITRARKILHSIEKTAEVSQGGSSVMIMGKADPGTSEKKPRQPRGPQGMHGSTARRQGHLHHQTGSDSYRHLHPPQKHSFRGKVNYPAKKGLGRNPLGISGAGGVAKPGWATTQQRIPGGGSKVRKVGTGTRGAYDRFGPKKPHTFQGKPVSPSVPSGRTGLRPAGWGTMGRLPRSSEKKVRESQEQARRSMGKAKPGTYHTKYGKVTISPNPRKPKPTTFGARLGEQERESTMYRAVREAVTLAQPRSAAEQSAAFRKPVPMPRPLGEPAGPRSLAGEKTREFSREQFKPGFVKRRR